MSDALVKKYEEKFKETITVIHAAFEVEPQIVATIGVDKRLSATEKCEVAFRLTNSINTAWYASDDVNYIGPKKTCRSTAMHDFILIGTNKYKFTSTGWELV
tara:strand:+ start:3331 stop:3636 length:306 start_codon:yes stop_codon:yes gene_type:complete